MSAMPAEQQARNNPDLIALKSAAYSLNLTPEGLRRRLLRLGVGIRQGRRWYIAAHLIDEMQRAAEILGGRK
jgi:hypothetical protein